MNVNESESHTTDGAMNQRSLDTERLLLDQFLASDAATVEVLLNDREIASNTFSIEFPYPAGAGLKWIETHKSAWESGDGVVYAIRLKTDNQLIGAIGIEIDKAEHRGELGYWIGREFWNHGYCSEAANRIVAFGFATLGLHKITSHHLARNPASGRVLQKIGMIKEGELRSHVRKWGVFEDVVLYGTLVTDGDQASEK